MNILVTGANGQLGNEMLMVIKGSKINVSVVNLINSLKLGKNN